jgi:heme exporter protein D
MQWGGVSEFLNMGGYAAYVWGSYGVCVALVIAEIMSARSRRRRAVAEARRTGVRGDA